MAPSFALPKSLKRSRRSGVVSSGTLRPIVTPERHPYGTTHLFIGPQVDLHTPGGRYRQSTTSSPFAPRTDASSGELVTLQHTPGTPARPQRDHRAAQWRTWAMLVIPRLIPIWLELLRTSEGLRTIPQEMEPCDCLPTVRKLRITLVSLQGISNVNVCGCKAPQSLLRIGYLVSAPVCPTYAFDVQMLDFMRLLHLRTAPNKSAWSATLEMFLRARGYDIRGKDVIRRKLASSLKWFTYLRAETERVVLKTILNPDSATVEDDGDEFWEDVDSNEEQKGLEYLARRCPLCFGDAGAFIHFLFDIIVCLDACFTQKRRNPVRGKGNDPPLKHHPSVFLTSQEIDAAEKMVNEARPARPPPPPPVPVETDTVEQGMKVPKSVLDACLESFTAADEKRTKASTKFFADTGLMAMLCRHDQVLWLANMTSAGERQYYALALIIKLFEHLPAEAKVGILYDIGCQLERSIVKWDFIPTLRGRISWGVSVFHAYGHQWPCQLVYHPRKRKGFGLSDGEGCERLWSSLEFLIPTLRVSGYHQRLFTLDVQVVFETENGCRGLGEWLLRKFRAAQKKRGEALNVIADLTFGEDELEVFWMDQVKVQTRPLTRATGGLANRTIKVILSLIDISAGLGQEIASISRKLARNPSIETFQELIETRSSLSEQKKIIDSQVESKRNSLGVGDRQDLRVLVNDKYLQTRMKALAVKERLRAKVQDRKFELERVDRACGGASASDTRLHAHVRSQVSRHQPNIVNLMKKFNDLCVELDRLIREGKATRGACPPRRIDSGEVYSLDVDAPIWDDRGLNDQGQGPVPLWLANDDVRSGIASLLVVQRCDEEIRRLRTECNSLRVWAKKESALLQHALDSIGDPGLKYQLQLKQDELIRSIRSWQHSIDTISPLVTSGDWGVDPQVVDQAGVFPGRAEPSEGEQSQDDDSLQRSPEIIDEESLWDSDSGELAADDRVLLEMEALNLLSIGETPDTSDVQDLVLNNPVSPRKRRRVSVERNASEDEEALPIWE